MSDEPTGPAPEAVTSVAKAGTAWLGVGVGHIEHFDWAGLAAKLAALYTLILIGEWLWKRILRPLAESRGWIKPRRRRVLTDSGPGELAP